MEIIHQENDTIVSDHVFLIYFIKYYISLQKCTILNNEDNAEQKQNRVD